MTRFLLCLVLTVAGALHAARAAEPAPVALPACEPVVLRQPFRVTDAGRYYYYQWCKVGEPGTDLGGRVTDGFLDGAGLRIYRPADGSLKPTDTGTVGVFRGRGNGWIVTGHSGRLTQLLGEDSPIAQDEQGIALREDWEDMEPGDIVIVDREAGTEDGRILSGLGEAAAGAFPWRAEGKEAAAHLVMHDPSDLAQVPEWLTAGSGCLMLGNGSRREQARFRQGPAEGVQPGDSLELRFRARAEGPGLEIKATWAGHEVGGFVPTDTWQEFTLPFQVQAGEGGPGFVVPVGTTLYVDDFGGGTGAQAQGGTTTLSTVLPAPSAVSLDSLLSGQPSSTILFGEGGPRFAAPLQESIPQFLARCERMEGRVVPVIELSPLHDEQEWWNLAAYLAAPWRDEADTRRTNPYAYLRLEAHNRRAPWTEAFPAIEIRLAHRDPAVEGAGHEAVRRLARYVARQVLPGTPWWGGDLRVSYGPGTEQK